MRSKLSKILILLCLLNIFYAANKVFPHPGHSNSPNINLIIEPIKDGYLVYGENVGLIPYTVTLTLPILVNLESSVKMPFKVVIPPETTNNFILELKKKNPDSPSQYRWGIHTSPGNQLIHKKKVQQSSWLFDTRITEDGKDNLEEPEQFRLETPETGKILYDPKGFTDNNCEYAIEAPDKQNPEVVRWKITNRKYDGYKKKLLRSDFLTIRVEKSGRTRVFFAQNGCLGPRKVTVKFTKFNNMDSSKKLPYIVTVPPLTEIYMFYIKCPNNGKFGYKYTFIYK